MELRKPCVLGDGENRQGESSEEYSTEDCGGGRGLCPETNEVAGETLQKRKHNKVGGKEGEKNFTGMQGEDSDRKSGNSRSTQAKCLEDACTIGRSARLAQKKFFREVSREKQQEKKGKTGPAGWIEPGLVKGEFEPGGEEEGDDDGGSRSR